MDEDWLATAPRFQRGRDPEVDANDGPSMYRNYRLICLLIDSFNEYVGDATLTADELLSVNAAFYRYEMRNMPPPRTLGVDCTLNTEWNELRDVLVCDTSEMIGQRAVFSFDHRTDGIQVLLNEYDATLAFRRRLDISHTDDLPRDTFADAKTIWKRAATKLGIKWRTSLKGGTNRQRRYRKSLDNGQAAMNSLDRPPCSDFDDRYESTMEARNRLVTILCWFRRHQPSFLPRILGAMRTRAVKASSLYVLAERFRNTARQVAAHRAHLPASQRDPLTSIVRDVGGEELGDVLWPYLPYEASTPLMACSKELHAWGLRFHRRMRLRLADTSEDQREWECEAHRCEADGSLTMQKNRQIKIKPLLEHRFMTHLPLPEGHDSQFLLEYRTHAHPTHGTAVDTTRSTTRAFLVFDDDSRTAVPCFGKPALKRWDGQGRLIGPWLDQIYAHFPKGGLPTIVVSLSRLSSEFKRKNIGDTKFRIVVEVDLVHADSPADVVSDVTYVAETAPFRVVARLESESAAQSSKERQAMHATEHAYHAQLVRDHQPSTATDVRDQNFDAMDFLDYDTLLADADETPAPPPPPPPPPQPPQPQPAAPVPTGAALGEIADAL